MTQAHSSQVVEESRLTSLLHWARVLLVAVAVSFFIKIFVLQAFSIPSLSMAPTLQVGDRLVVEKVTYRLGDIQRGDIVVFHPPVAAQVDPGVEHLIKRVVGLPGETVEARDGLVYVDGELVPETYLPSGTLTSNLPPTKVAPGEVFVMGDNRTQSGDSRIFGSVDLSLIEGRALSRIWPSPSGL